MHNLVIVIILSITYMYFIAHNYIFLFKLNVRFCLLCILVHIDIFMHCALYVYYETNKDDYYYVLSLYSYRQHLLKFTINYNYYCSLLRLSIFIKVKNFITLKCFNGNNSTR